VGNVVSYKFSFRKGITHLIVSLQEALDISADLHELSRCPVGLVSAGVKSILDIGKFVLVLTLLLLA
jgi:pseudouridine-5'-phosphate glycosidase